MIEEAEYDDPEIVALSTTELGEAAQIQSLVEFGLTRYDAVLWFLADGVHEDYL